MGRKRGRVELCQFTPGLKGELFPKLRAAFERRELLIPSSRKIWEDLHGIHPIVTGSGQISYRAISSADGHSDRCTALSLALRTTQNAPVPSGAATVIQLNRSIFRGMPRGMRIA